MANEVQTILPGASPTLLESGALQLTFDGQTTASIDHSAINTTATFASAIDTALEALSNIGSGDLTTTWDTDRARIEFGGSLANTNVPQITVASNTLKRKADTISVNVTQTGVEDAYETFDIDFGGASAGTVEFIGDGGTSDPFDVESGSFQTDLESAVSTAAGVTFTGSDLGGGVWRMTAGDPGDVGMPGTQNDTTNGTGVSINSVTEGATGQPSIVEISLDDAPTAGQLALVDSFFQPVTLNYNDDAATVEAAINAGTLIVSGAGGVTVTGAGTTGDPWVITSAANESFFGDLSASDFGVDPLLTPLGLTIATTTQGSGGGGVSIPIAAYHYQHHLISMT